MNTYSICAPLGLMFLAMCIGGTGCTDEGGTEDVTLDNPQAATSCVEPTLHQNHFSVHVRPVVSPTNTSMYLGGAYANLGAFSSSARVFVDGYAAKITDRTSSPISATLPKGESGLLFEIPHEALRSPHLADIHVFNCGVSDAGAGSGASISFPVKYAPVITSVPSAVIPTTPGMSVSFDVIGEHFDPNADAQFFWFSGRIKASTQWVSPTKLRVTALTEAATFPAASPAIAVSNYTSRRDFVDSLTSNSVILRTDRTN